jgi:iron(III) transport system substrate-binding protein
MPLSSERRDLRHTWPTWILWTGLLVSSLACLPARAAETITLYSAQHEQMVDQVTQMFTRETGITVRVRSGEAPEIANQIAQEGARSPADVYFTENSPELTLLDEKGLLAAVDPTTLAAVPAKYSAADGHWVGVFARVNVLAYNPALIKADQLPHSLMDLAQPQWRGKVAIAPSDADFLPLVGAVVALHGEAAALEWLKGLRRNAQLFDDDEGVVAAVDRGTVATGVINSYYWARLWTEQGAAKTKSRIYYFPPGDVGGLINVSGAAVLKSSKHQAAAQKFVAFLVSRKVQATIAQGNVDFEYPLVPAVVANPLLKPFNELQPPSISISQLGDDQSAARLLRQAGLL